MRSILLSIAIVLGLGGTSSAGGLFVEEGLGVADYRGDLTAYDGEGRLQLSLGMRRGPYTLSLLGGATLADSYGVDCYGPECTEAATYAFFGADLKRAWPLYEHNEHAAVRLFMHGGVRLFDGDDAIEGYRGPGASGGAGIEGDYWLLGYAFDFGIDAMWLRAPDGSEPPPLLARDPSKLGSTGDIFAAAPYFMFSGRIGWM